jgi:hypothetical protein
MQFFDAFPARTNFETQLMQPNKYIDSEYFARVVYRISININNSHAEIHFQKDFGGFPKPLPWQRCWLPFKGHFNRVLLLFLKVIKLPP